MDYITVKFSEMDFKKITFSDIKKNKYGGNFVNILYDGKIPLVKFPKMNAVFGFSAMEDKNKPGTFSYSLETSFDNKNPESALKDSYEKAISFDEFIIKTVCKNHKQWLNEDEKPELKWLKKSYTPMVKVPLDKNKKPMDYPSRCKASFYANKDGNFTFSCFDKDLKRIPVNVNNFKKVVSPGDDVMTVRQLRQIWFNSMGGFGVSWDLQQLRVFPKVRLSDHCVLSDDEDDEKSTHSEEGTNTDTDTDTETDTEKKTKTDEKDDSESASDEEVSDEEVSDEE